ncbi:hypothetical protein NDN08_005600 [Rhodosorus marinus]|uniref:Pyroglutamyl-peptidase I n=1 Tax=Rhodosorus marinus TaxID=101924 RepID=A0AAV8V213_9RHOD|nr:hypothetical protein NDN08_005600 [Rhodosorus marinus]
MGSWGGRAGGVGGSVVEEDQGLVEFHLTGFGKFGSLKENPTENLIELIREELRVDRGEFLPARIASCHIWEVSAEYTDDALSKLHNNLSKPVNRPIVFLHLGVDCGANNFRLEQKGVNEADFQYHDERGFSPRKQPIVRKNGTTTHAIQTTLPTAKLASILREQSFDVQTSTDAGRFVCNWTYYLSLHHAKNSGALVLFLHVPSVSQIKLEEQLQFVKALIRQIAVQVRAEEESLPTVMATTPALGTS